MRASAKSGEIVGGGPTVTFGGGACGLYPVGDGAVGDLGHGNIPPLHGTALGDLSVKFGVRFTEN